MLVDEEVVHKLFPEIVGESTEDFKYRMHAMINDIKEMPHLLGALDREIYIKRFLSHPYFKKNAQN